MNDWVRIDEKKDIQRQATFNSGLSALEKDALLQHTVDQAPEGEKLPIV